MGKVKQKTKTTYRKSKTKLGHCPVCGAYTSKRGKKKS